ncbi:MAG: triose-phosphate isomerase [Bacilli bacterium]|jgi:triosephosphate isomerase|nr:triose-phosphate isomerase [Bacilli bacterium]
MRRKLLLGNWKMNKLASEAKEFAIASKPLVAKAKENKIDIGVAPTYMSLATVRKFAAKKMIVAAQNVHFEDHGAFTGEVSIPMLKEFKIDWVILGHSERRTYDGETSEKCNKKMKALLANDMVPVYCCGETLEQFDAGETKAVVADQIKKGFEGISEEDAKKVVVAYEPIWSIGTGKNASTEIAQDVCKYIRKVLKGVVGKAASKIRILYGGSVKPENVKAYLSCPDVDGALVGGASLKIDSYEGLLNNIL